MDIADFLRLGDRLTYTRKLDSESSKWGFEVVALDKHKIGLQFVSDGKRQAIEDVDLRTGMIREEGRHTDWFVPLPLLVGRTVPLGVNVEWEGKSHKTVDVSFTVAEVAQLNLHGLLCQAARLWAKWDSNTTETSYESNVATYWYSTECGILLWERGEETTHYSFGSAYAFPPHEFLFEMKIDRPSLRTLVDKKAITFQDKPRGHYEGDQRELDARLIELANKSIGIVPKVAVVKELNLSLEEAEELLERFCKHGDAKKLEVGKLVVYDFPTVRSYLGRLPNQLIEMLLQNREGATKANLVRITGAPIEAIDESLLELERKGIVIKNLINDRYSIRFTQES